MGDKSDHSENSCIVCYRATVTYYSVGSCEHSVCFECSARMRVLLEQNECPICRKADIKVAFTKGKKSYSELSNKLPMFIFLPRYGIYLESEKIKEEFDDLLEFSCQLCEHRQSFRDFDDLRSHVQRQHERFYCSLCVEHIKLFPTERRCYSRADLGVHKRKGDKNDKSHRGHPLCQFCDQRYFDSDELYKHLRKDHYFCHFCDADGLNDFFNGYQDLRVHFRREHFLCEEENCKNELFTSVFRSEIDLKAHLTTVHSKLLGKHGVKQARALDLEFSLAPRPEDEKKRNRFQRRGPNDNQIGENVNLINEEEVEIQPAIPPPKKLIQHEISSTQDFPSLGGSDVQSSQSNGVVPVVGNSSIAQKVALASGKNVSRNMNGHSSKNMPINKPSWNAKVCGSSKMDEEFPALVGSGSSRKPAAAESFSRQQQRNAGPQEDFPALARPKQPPRSSQGASSTSWNNKASIAIEKSAREEYIVKNGKKVAPAPILLERPDDDESNFPSLPVDRFKEAKLKLLQKNSIGDEDSSSKKKKKIRNNKDDNKKAAAAILFNSNPSNNNLERETEKLKQKNLEKKDFTCDDDFPSLQPLKKIVYGPPPGFS